MNEFIEKDGDQGKLVAREILRSIEHLNSLLIHAIDKLRTAASSSGYACN